MTATDASVPESLADQFVLQAIYHAGGALAPDELRERTHLERGRARERCAALADRGYLEARGGRTGGEVTAYALTDEGVDAAAAIDRARVTPDPTELLEQLGPARETRRELAALVREIDATTEEEERVRAYARVAQAVCMAGTAAVALRDSSTVAPGTDVDEFVREFVRQYRRETGSPGRSE